MPNTSTCKIVYFVQMAESIYTYVWASTQPANSILCMYIRVHKYALPRAFNVKDSMSLLRKLYCAYTYTYSHIYMNGKVVLLYPYIQMYIGKTWSMAGANPGLCDPVVKRTTSLSLARTSSGVRTMAYHRLVPS
jgi:hypothetical protein